jgi:hypothetical protein
VGGIAKETRRDRIPVARAYVSVRKRNQEGEGTCGPGILVGGIAKETRRDRVPVARAFVGVRKRNQE